MATDWDDLERAISTMHSSVWKQEFAVLRSIFAGCPEDSDGTLIFELLSDEEDGRTWCVEVSAVRYTRCTSKWLYYAIKRLLARGVPLSAELTAKCMTALTLLARPDKYVSGDS